VSRKYSLAKPAFDYVDFRDPSIDFLSVAAMDIVQAVSGYITKMVSAGDSASGTQAAKMKILLLDSETVGLSL